jgi:hypothetical protein
VTFLSKKYLRAKFIPRAISERNRVLAFESITAGKIFIIRLGTCLVQILVKGFQRTRPGHRHVKSGDKLRTVEIVHSHKNGCNVPKIPSLKFLQP